MKNISIKNTFKLAAFVTTVSSFLAAFTYAESGPMHEGESMHGHDGASGHMMQQETMAEHHREVIGTGRINKIMADKHMINISHEPIAEMDWPKMRMNFKTMAQVKMDDLKPGQEVTFTLDVDGYNNYVIKKIVVKP